MNKTQMSEIQAKIRACKALQGMTVDDVCRTAKFRENLAAYWQAQKDDRKTIRKSYEAMRRAWGAKGYKVPAHVIDDLAGLDAEQMAGEYIAVLGRISKRPAAERLYIQQIGQQAYNLTVAQFVCDEYPELHEYFYPKSKTN